MINSHAGYLKFKSDVGQAIKEARLKKNLTHQELAILTTISASNISRYERSEVTPSLHNTVLLAAGLGITVSDLIRY